MVSITSTHPAVLQRSGSFWFSRAVGGHGMAEKEYDTAAHAAEIYGTHIANKAWQVGPGNGSGYTTTII